MESVKRGRGRPKGTGDDDSAPLMAVARALVDDPSIKATTAMKAVLRTRRNWSSSDEALIRRWQGKWKTDGESYKQRVQVERVAAIEAERQRRERAPRHDPRTAYEIYATHRHYVSEDAIRKAGDIFQSRAYADLQRILAQEAARADVFAEIRRKALAYAEERETAARIFAEVRAAGRLPQPRWIDMVGSVDLRGIDQSVAAVERTMRAVDAISTMPKLSDGF